MASELDDTLCVLVADVAEFDTGWKQIIAAVPLMNASARFAISARFAMEWRSVEWRSVGRLSVTILTLGE